jgi:hypothetical protein
MSMAAAFDPNGDATSSCTSSAGCATYSFFQASGIAQDSSGNLLVSLRNHHTIWSCTPGGSLSSLASCSRIAGSGLSWNSVEDIDGTENNYGYWVDESVGNPLLASFSYPMGLAFDANAQTLYVADQGNHVIREIDFVNGAPNNVITVAGAGVRTTLNGDPDVLGYNPVGVPLADTSLCDRTTNNTCGAPSGSGNVNNADGLLAVMNKPTGVAVRYSPTQSQLVFADQGNNVIRTIGSFDTAATPTFSPAAGAYGPSQTVTIASTTPSSTIYYTIDGTGPTTSSTRYTAPITVATNQTVRAIATATDYQNSTIAEATYRINGAAATPTFRPNGGFYTPSTSVTITSTTPSSTIYYTTDGTTPTTSSTRYTAPFTVGSSQTVKAIATATA